MNVTSVRIGKKLVRFLKLLIPLLVLTGCAGKDDPDLSSKPKDKPVEEIYQEAWDYQGRYNYYDAARLFEEVDRQYPYSPWATDAQLMYAWSLYEGNRNEEARVALDRFIELHPQHEYAPYAWYLKAISYYEEITDVGRDQEMTELALKSLEQVERRYADTPYARDAALKRDLTLDHLAGKEMEIGRFYQKRNNHLAAIGRFKNVIDNYQTTAHTAEALHRLTESYLALGLREEAQRNAAVLGYNYPGSNWYEDSFKLLK